MRTSRCQCRKASCTSITPSPQDFERGVIMSSTVRDILNKAPSHNSDPDYKSRFKVIVDDIFWPSILINFSISPCRSSLELWGNMFWSTATGLSLLESQLDLTEQLVLKSGVLCSTMCTVPPPYSTWARGKSRQTTITSPHTHFTAYHIRCWTAFEPCFTRTRIRGPFHRLLGHVIPPRTRHIYSFSKSTCSNSFLADILASITPHFSRGFFIPASTRNIVSDIRFSEEYEEWMARWNSFDMIEKYRSLLDLNSRFLRLERSGHRFCMPRMIHKSTSYIETAR